MMDELKQCPFCGGEARTHYVKGYELWEVSCGQCGVEFSAYLSETDAIEAWNRRAERKKGQWIYDTERIMHDGWIYNQYHCSLCNYQVIGGLQNFCPYCGADMRGE